MSKYALRLVHFLSEDKPINEYFIPFSSGALLNLLKTDFSKIIEDVFFSDVEYIKELLNKREGTLESFLRRYNLFDVKDQNGYNYFVDLTKEDFADEEWRANDPEDIYEYSLWDYFADARLILDTVQIREPETNVAEVQAINDEAEATMFSRSELFLQKVIFSIIVAIDSGEEGEQFIPPTLPEDYLEYVKSGSFADSLDEIEKLTYVFLNDYISDMPYSLYAASYDYIYKLFKIIVGDKVTQYKLVEYMDKLHKSLWEVSNKRPFDFIKNMKYYLDDELFVRSLLMCYWDNFFINIFPKGQKILYSIKDIFSSSPDIDINKEWQKRGLYRKKIEEYYPTGTGCFCVALTGGDKIYFALSGFDYQGEKIINSKKIKNKIEWYKKLAEYIISELNLKKDSYCSLNDATRCYTEIQSSIKSIKYIQGEANFVYFKDIKNDKIDTRKLGAMFGCCERKILGFIELSQGKKDNYGKISFFSRWAPCEKCMPAIYLQKKYCFYAFADSFNSLENNNMELSKYEVDGHYNSRYWLKKQIIHNSYYSNEKKQADIVDDDENCKSKDYILLGVIGNKNTKKIKAYSVFSVSTGTILKMTKVEYDLFININSNLPNYLKYITELKNICNGKYTHFKERCNHNKEDKINDNTLICGGSTDFALILNNEIVSKYKYIRMGIDDEKAIFCDIELQKVYYGSKHAFILKDDKGNNTIKYCYTDNTNEYCYRDLAKDRGISYSIVDNIEKNYKADGWHRIDIEKDVRQNQLLILGKPKFLTVKLKELKKAANSKISMYISPTILDLDISSFKYGNSIFCNINLIQVSKGIENQFLGKVIEACLIDKLLVEIEDGNISGSLIEVRTSELRKRIAHEVELLDETDRRIEGISIERY